MIAEGGAVVVITDYPIILVTGGTGWLGRRLIRALTQGSPEMGVVGGGGCRVRCLVLPQEPMGALGKLNVEVISGDVRDPDAARALVSGAENGLVIHLAGIIHPPGRTRYFQHINVEGTANILSAAKTAGVKRMVVMSSNSPLGCNPTPEHVFTDDSPYNPYMGYGRSKWRMELLLRKAMIESNAPEIVIARAPWFYGPGQPPRQALFFSMIRNGKFPLMGEGLNRRSMGYVDSLALGLLLCAVVDRAAGQTYWLSDERPYSMIEIVETVKAVLRDDFSMTVSEHNMTVPPVIADFARLVDTTIQAMGFYHQKIHVLSEMNQTIAGDISKATRELGYKPLVGLREGMKRSVQWCLDNGVEI